MSSYKKFKQEVAALNKRSGAKAPKVSLVEDSEGELIFIVIRFSRLLYRDRIAFQIDFAEFKKNTECGSDKGLLLVSTEENLMDGMLCFAVNNRQHNWQYGTIAYVLDGVIDDLLKCRRPKSSS